MSNQFRTYSIPEVAKELGIGRRSVLRLIEEGRLRFIQIGKQKRISHKALFEFIESATVNNKYEPPNKQQIKSNHEIDKYLKNVIMEVSNGINLQT